MAGLISERDYFASDMHYDIEEAGSRDDVRRLFYRLVARIGESGLQHFSIKLPGKYGRHRGVIDFKGTTEKFDYSLTVKMNKPDSTSVQEK